MEGNSGHPTGPASICGGDLPVGVELLVDRSVETQQQEGTITETSSGSCCGLDDRVAAKQWAQITS